MSANQNKNLLLLKLWHPVRVLIKASLFRTCVICGKPSCRRVRDLLLLLYPVNSYQRSNVYYNPSFSCLSRHNLKGNGGFMIDYF